MSGPGWEDGSGLEATEKDYGWKWSATESAIHFRLLFPHLSGVYDDLPQSARSLLSREDARRYDSHLNNAKRVIDRVTEEDPELRRELSRDLLLTVLPRRWIQITIDLLRDTFENFFATPSYYFRIAASHLMDRRDFHDWFPSDAAVWASTRLTFHHPRQDLFTDPRQ